MTFRSYTGKTGYTEDFFALSAFLHRISCDGPRVGLVEWVFLEWQMARGAYKAEDLAGIGLWTEGGAIVAATPYEDHVNAVALCTDAAHRRLRPEMLEYAERHMAQGGTVTVIIEDGDLELQRLAFQKGFRPTQDKAATALLDIAGETTRYALPEGFRVTGFDEEFDVLKYNRVMWYGFNHGPDAPKEDGEMISWRTGCVSSPHANRHLMTAVVAPDGSYASHCCMWYRGGENAIVEPVATDPRFRKLGCGRAAVLEAAKRCGELGAKRAFVGSGQQFYYSIGFYPVTNETFWRKAVSIAEGGEA